MAIHVSSSVSQQILRVTKRETEEEGTSMELRPRQGTYGGSSYNLVPSVARRLFKRSAHCIRSQSEEPIFNPHESDRNLSSALGDTAAADNSKAIFSSVVAGSELSHGMALLNKERKVLVDCINNARGLAGRIPLMLDMTLSDTVQNHAETLTDLVVSMTIFDQAALPTPPTIVEETDLLSKAPNAIRLVSPPGYGALSCGEMWFAGKYKEHHSGHPNAKVVAANRAMVSQSILRRIEASRPVFQKLVDPAKLRADEQQTFPFPAMHNASDEAHPPTCPCHLRRVWEIITDAKWLYIGIGVCNDGRWVIELADDLAAEETFDFYEMIRDSRASFSEEIAAANAAADGQVTSKGKGKEMDKENDQGGLKMSTKWHKWFK